jgi:hypothetical protein
MQPLCTRAATRAMSGRLTGSALIAAVRWRVRFSMSAADNVKASSISGSVTVPC